MEADELMAALERQLKPYRGTLPSFPRLPEAGVPRAEVAGLVERLAAIEDVAHDPSPSGSPITYHSQRRARWS